MDILSFLADYYTAIAIYGSLLSVIAIVLVIINTVRTSKIIHKYKRLMRGVENKNLEALLDHCVQSVRSSINKVEQIEEKQKTLSNTLKKCVQGIGVVRYNPFEEMGSDLSFSVAFLDAEHNGVVITGIFGRQNTSTYTKPITKGISSHTLSGEEISAINIAKKSIDQSL